MEFTIRIADKVIYDTILFHGSAVAVDVSVICSQQSQAQANPHIQGCGESFSVNVRLW